jgi:hypothetical protein
MAYGDVVYHVNRKWLNKTAHITSQVAERERERERENKQEYYSPIQLHAH